MSEVLQKVRTQVPRTPGSAFLLFSVSGWHLQTRAASVSRASGQGDVWSSNKLGWAVLSCRCHPTHFALANVRVVRCRESSHPPNSSFQSPSLTWVENWGSSRVKTKSCPRRAEDCRPYTGEKCQRALTVETLKPGGARTADGVVF